MPLTNDKRVHKLFNVALTPSCYPRCYCRRLCSWHMLAMWLPLPIPLYHFRCPFHFQFVVCHRTSHIFLEYVHINGSKVWQLKENIPHPHLSYINQLPTGNWQQLSCAESNWQMQSTPNLARTSAFYAQCVQPPTQRAHRSPKYEHNVWFRAEQISHQFPVRVPPITLTLTKVGAPQKASITAQNKAASHEIIERWVCAREREIECSLRLSPSQPSIRQFAQFEKGHQLRARMLTSAKLVRRFVY